MSQEIDYGVKTFDFATDSTQEFVNGVAGVTDSNMHKLTNAIKNKVTLNGQASDQQNFNFIDGKVVQENLIEVINKRVSGLYQISGLSVTNDFTLAGCIKNYNNTTLWHVPNVGPMRLVVDAASNKLIINGFEDKRILETAITPTIEFIIIKQGTSFIIYVNGVKAVTDLKYANEDTINKWNTNKFNFGYSNAILDVICTCNNKILTPQEIQHSFSVLNNTESIKSVTIGDKNYILASDTEHVQDRTGRTQEQINRRFYKRSCKEFTSTGGAITVPNAEEGYVLSGEIKGQTVKNYASWGSVQKISSQLYRSVGSVKLPVNGCTIVNKYDKQIQITLQKSDGTWLYARKIGANGFYTLTETDTKGEVAYIKQLDGFVSDGWNTDTDLVYFSENRCIFTDLVSKDLFSGALSFGLSSTQAILSNNGQSYPIYATAEDKENKKVILCHGVGGAYDTVQQLEDGSGVWTKNTNSIVLNNGDWTLGQTDTNTIRFQITNPSTTAINGTSNVVASLFQTGANYSNDIESLFFNSNGTTIYIRISKSKLTTQDIAGFKAWLQANPVTVIYQLATPVVTTIPKELMPTILTANKINILNVESPVAPSSFTVNVPTSDGVKKEFVLTLQNSWTGSLKALLLQNGRVRIVGAITAPSTFANIIANLPAELKPSVARKIVGLNGNTPIAIEIDTVPTVKCPTTVTGSIEINAEYEL